MKKKYGIIFIILSIILVLAIVLIVLNTPNFLNTNPKNVALNQDEITNISSEYVFNPNLSQSLYTTTNVKPGFVTGYYRSFQYQNLNNAADLIVILNSVSFYNSSESALNDFNNDQQSGLNFGCNQFSIKTIGDGSFGCLFRNYPIGGIISYTVYFYKGNKVGFVSIEKEGNGTTDFTNDAIAYSEIISNRF